MKDLSTQAEGWRFAADFVEPRQPVVDVKDGILESLCHNRTGELLELEHELLVCGALFFIKIFREAKEQEIAQKIKDRFLDRGIAPFRRRDRTFNHRAILL